MKILQTLNGKVLVKPIVEEKRVDGIDIPDSVDKEKSNKGLVLVGLDDIKKDSLVLYRTLTPMETVHDGEDCLLIDGEDIYAVIEEVEIS